MSLDLSARAVDLVELMDDPDADEEALGRTYRRFSAVNAVVSRPGRLYRRDIRPRAAAGRVLRILDIGAGGGDLCRDLVRRLRRDGLRADVTALDADERAIRWASAHDDGAGIRYRHAFSGDLVAAGDTYDVVLSNHVLHHLDAAALHAVLDDSASWSVIADSSPTTTSPAAASPTGRSPWAPGRSRETFSRAPSSESTAS